jgi:DNA-binding NtrC family response regulator
MDMSILVVHLQSHVRRMMVRELFYSFQVEEAGSYGEALTALRLNPSLRAVVTNEALDAASGMALLHHVRRTRPALLRILIRSGDRDPRAILPFVRDVDAVVDSSWRPGALIATVQRELFARATRETVEAKVAYSI